MNFTKFLGFKNYFDVLSNKEIVKTMYLTFFVSFVSLFFALLLGTLLALWINISKGIFAYSLQILSLIPWVTSMIVSALLWRWMLQGDFGLINYILSRLGAKGIGFLTDVKIVVYTLIFVMTWRVLAYVMVQILAGLKAIPREYEEAANIDGANSWQLFWKVKFPLLKTPVAISCIIVALSNINNVTVPLSLTGGGPGTTTTVLAVEVYKQSFSYYHFGESSALSILLLLVNLVLIFLYIKVVRYDINKI
jgi:ABC-type sugar transport system permease subunit